MYDVIVVGGGPAGSRAAFRLASMGHRVAVLERKPGPGGPVCCTGVVGRECSERFSIDDGIVLSKVKSARLCSPSGNAIKLWRPEVQACVLDRVAFNVSMARRAEGAGAEYHFDTAVRDVVVSDSEARVQTWRQGGIRARAVILASGFSPGLTARLGLGKIRDFTVGAQAELATPEVSEVEVCFGRQVAPGFFAWLVPLSPGRARVGLMTRKDPGTCLASWVAFLSASGKVLPAKPDVLYGAIPLRPLPRTSAARLLAVGDAAGQVKPTSGGGIYYGLLCADIAADVLHEALEEDDLSARRLRSYERRWKRRLGRELRIGYWARRLFERLSDRQLDRLFEIISANGIHEQLLQADVSFDWHSQAVLKLIGNTLVSKALGTIRLPFRD